MAWVFCILGRVGGFVFGRPLDSDSDSDLTVYDEDDDWMS